MKTFKIFRITQGLTQAELARKAGYSQPLISNIECGFKAPSKEQRQKIAAALGQSEDLIFSEKEDE